MPVRRRIGWFHPIRAASFRSTNSQSTVIAQNLRRYTVTQPRLQRCRYQLCDPVDQVDGLIAQYCVQQLHLTGWAHSFEVWDAGELVGGLYGVRINHFFAGESMFHHATDASKVALVHLVDWLKNTGGQLLDVQWTTELVSLDAIDIARTDYLELLKDAVSPNSRKNDDETS